MARKPEGSARKTATKATKARAAKKPSAPKKAAKPTRKPRRAKRPVDVVAPEEAALAIEALNRRYYDAFQSLSLEEMAKLWWHDDVVSCVHPGWDIRHGWADVIGSYEEIFASTRLIRFALGDVRVRVIGDVAYVTCVENLVSEEQAAGDYLGAVLATNLFERRRGEWKLVHHHTSPFASDEGDLPEGPLH